MADTTNGEIAGESTFVVPNTNWPGPVRYHITVVNSASDAGEDGLGEIADGAGGDVTSGVLTVTATTPMGVQSANAIQVLD